MATREQYEAWLQEAYRAVEVPAGVRLSEIDDEAVRQTTHTWRGEIFEWEVEFEHYLHHDRPFSLAIWNGNNSLQGLSVGKILNEGSLALEVIEAMPKLCTLKGQIFPLTNKAMEHYARLAGVSEIRLLQPLDGAREYYCTKGYIYEPGKDHCVRFLK